MACLAAPEIPDIDNPLLALPSIPELPTATVGLALCCSYSLSTPTEEDIAAWLGITPPSTAVFLNLLALPGATPLMMLLQKAKGEINQLLDKIQVPDCALDGD